MNQALLTAAESVFDRVFAELHAIAMKFETLEREVFSGSGKLTEDDVKRIRPHMVRSLQRLERHAFALGVILDEGVVDAAPFWLNWIERDADGSIQDDSNIRYPWRGTFYEYTSSEWMSKPRLLGQDVIVGPYVDFDKYLITLSTPILIQGRFVGVAAADLRLHDYERLVALPLSRLTDDCMICNGEGRVVVSNTFALSVGSINEEALQAGTTIGRYDWRVVCVAKS